MLRTNSWPRALTLTRSMKSRATLKFTSASSKASRTSRRASLALDSEILPRPRRFRYADSQWAYNASTTKNCPQWVMDLFGQQYGIVPNMTVLLVARGKPIVLPAHANLNISGEISIAGPVREDISWALARGKARQGSEAGKQDGKASSARRGGSRLRLLRDLRPQDVRTHGHRRALRHRGVAREAAPVSGRGRHDLVRHVREDDVQRPSVEVRGGHGEHRRRNRFRSGRRLAVRRGARRRGRARARPSRLRHPEAFRHSRPHDRGPREREGGGDFLRAGERAPTRHRDDPRPRGNRDPDGPPLRAARHGPLRPSRHGTGRSE